MKQLDLDGVYTRVKRDGKYCSLCFTDLTQEEQIQFLSGLSNDSLMNLCIYLGDLLRQFGGQIDLANK